MAPKNYFCRFMVWDENERMKKMELKDRCTNFLDELRLPVTRFCISVGISKTAFYTWRRGELVLSQKTFDRIDAYLRRYGF